jgi:SynChlorMet cassette radical SAM/SPASM protein ScmF
MTVCGKIQKSGGGFRRLKRTFRIGQWVLEILSKSTKLKLYFDLPIAFRKMSRMFGANADGCSSCGILDILGVLANGSYALCGIGSHIPELVFGHVSTDHLGDVWKNNAILKELREGLPSRLEGICGNCLMKRMCSASCIAQNYYRSKSLWKPFWFCDEAHKKDLFPRSRLSPKLISSIA